MFRIDKSVVQVSGPADIPLIPLEWSLPEPEPEPEEESRAEENSTAPDETPILPAPDPQEQAEHIIEEARQEAAKIIRQAEEQAAEKQKNLDKQAMNIRVNAQREGFEMGEQEALQIYDKQQREAATQLSRLLTELAAAKDEFFAGAEGQLLDLSLAIAEKIVKTSLKEREVFDAMVKNALKNLRREGKIVVRVSEQQYNDFFQADSANFILGEETIKAEIINDPLLQPGDLLLESEDEAINAGADSQLKYIALAFGRNWECDS